jgi:hypothetical protein
MENLTLRTLTYTNSNLESRSPSGEGGGFFFMEQVRENDFNFVV